MKVGTDGALLGAWVDCSDVMTAIDVGAGAGLIALMLAQRNQNLVIHAVEIDPEASRQAKINFDDSPFCKRLSISNTDFKNCVSDTKFDLIVSNPPYFASSLRCPDFQRTAARHDDSLTISQLIYHSIDLMADRSRLAVILPTDRFAEFHSESLAGGLSLCRKTLVSTVSDKPPKRVLLEYANYSTESEENILNIETTHGHYSDDFIALMKDFYLKFD